MEFKIESEKNIQPTPPPRDNAIDYRTSPAMIFLLSTRFEAQLSAAQLKMFRGKSHFH